MSRPTARFLPSPDSGQPDGPVELVSRNDKWWVRPPPDHGDSGFGRSRPGKRRGREGAYALSDKGFQPLGRGGHGDRLLARQIVLGNPQLQPLERGKEKK